MQAPAYKTICMNIDSILKKNENTNVADSERVLSAAAGAFILIRALSKRNLGILNTALAGFLLYRGLTGNCPARSAIDKKVAEVQNDYSTPDPLIERVDDPAIVNRVVTP